jgi:ABC-type transport system substrate-binding protein
MDPEQRRAIYLKLQEILREDRPALPLYIAVDAYAVAAHVEGIPENTPNVQWFIFMHPEKLSIQKKS